MGDFCISNLVVFLILIVIWVIYRIVVVKRKKLNLKREIALNVFWVYFLAVVYFTFLRGGGLFVSLNNSRYMNLIPLKETAIMFKQNVGIKIPLYNVIGNILLFVPLGFFIPMLFKKCNNVKKVLLYGFTASLSIEVLQYFTAMTFSDIDDVIFNTLGTLLGLMCYRIFVSIIRKVKLENFLINLHDRENSNLIKLAIKPLGTMFICCLILTFSIIYLNTYSEKLTNEELSVKAFADSGNSKFVSFKEFDKYKFFLQDEGDYVHLCVMEKVLNNRYKISEQKQGNELNGDNDKSGYGVTILENHNKKELTAVVYGKNNNSDSISINLYGREYKEKLKSKKFFIIVYPHYEKFRENTDIYKIYGDEESQDLKIKFIDKDGNINSDMKHCR